MESNRLVHVNKQVRLVNTERIRKKSIDLVF